MAKIFSAPKEIKTPAFTGDWRKEEERYLNEIKALLKTNGFTGKNAGKIINFPMADSHASYMIASMKPLRLIHLETGDAWEFKYAHLLTAKEVNQKIAQQEAMEKLFSKKG